MITLSDNTGKSFEDAIIISGARDSEEGVAAEYEHLVAKFGVPGIDWKFIRQELIPRYNKYFDKFLLKDNQGKEFEVYFDITEFLGSKNYLEDEMRKCCKSNCKDEIRIKKFLALNQEILKNGIPYTVDGIKIMICTPLGNQVKFTEETKADVVLSGFCTAPDAAINYLKDKNNDKFRECRHSFNTPTMIRGIRKIFESIGIRDPQETLEIALSCDELDDEMNFLFTQLLCMISNDGKSDARSVEGVLRTSESIRNQANYSITAWYNRINTLLKIDGIILLMGNEAENLIKHTYLIDNGNFKIDYYNKLSNISLSDKITEKYKLFKVLHAAGIRRVEHRDRWLESECRLKINELLGKYFPNKMNKLT